MTNGDRIVVAQKGAREHYLTARAFHQRGQLASLIVDWYAPRNLLVRKGLALFGRMGRAGLAARAAGIPDGLVRPLRWQGLRAKWMEHVASRNGNLYDAYPETDAAFARAAAGLDLPSHDVFFGYSYASLEMLEAEKRRGVFTILDQIDPGPAEFRLVAEEMERYPEIAGRPQPFPKFYFDRVRREWELADMILVNSEWTRDAIVAEGANLQKIRIVPLAYELERGSSLEVGDVNLQTSAFNVPQAAKPLRVLWLGQVNVRKGIRYLLEAARRLIAEAVRFDVVGPIGIQPQVVSSAPRNVTFHGPVSRDEVARWYRQSDVFVLPTLSDGFALTQLEAMAYGKPVIATPNCGRVVTDNSTGFIVPVRDAQALADTITRFVRDRSCLVDMGARCIEEVKKFSVEAYAAKLTSIIQNRSRRSHQQFVEEARVVGA